MGAACAQQNGVLFTKLQSLLNSDTDLDSRSALLASINTSITSNDLASIIISPEVVSEALGRTKSGKADGTNLVSDHTLYASSSLTVFLSSFFTTILRHGYIPASLRDCVLQPVLKPGKDPGNSDSYRPNALAPTLSKVLEWCILIFDEAAFSTSPLQFGFKKGFSTDLCTGLLKNVIGRYTMNDSTVYGCFLDASKAFDRVNHTVLFHKLLEKNFLLVYCALSYFGTLNKKSVYAGTILARMSLQFLMGCVKEVSSPLSSSPFI